MKKLLLISTLLISGCTTSWAGVQSIKKYCESLPENYLNESLKSDVDKQTSIYIQNINQPCVSSSLCSSLIRKNEKWDFIEVGLDKNIYGKDSFPQEAGIYKLYRDYDFKNCINNLHIIAGQKNEYSNKKGTFCIASKKQSQRESKITLKFDIKNIDNPNSRITISHTLITFQEKKYGETTQMVATINNQHFTCQKNQDGKYNKITNIL